MCKKLLTPLLLAGMAGLTALTSLTGCDGSGAQVPLELLVIQEEAHHGRVVTTTGTVRTFEQPRHYWVEDAALNRVAIEPDARVSDYVGREVTVSGRFTASRQAGRLIEAETVILNDAAKDAAKDASAY